MTELNKIQIELSQKPGTRTEESQLIQNLLLDVLSNEEELITIIRNKVKSKTCEIQNKLDSLRSVLEFMENDLVREQYKTLLKEKEALDNVLREQK